MADPLTDLPPNILTEILSRLPLKSLCASRCACRAFLSLTTPPNPHFTRLHSSNAAQILLLQFPQIGHPRKPSIYLRFIEPELDLAVDSFVSTPLFQLPQLLRTNSPRFPEENKLALANSCNGLVYLVRVNERIMVPDERSVVCNPVTNEYILIPDVDRLSGLGSRRTLSMWLGFSPGSNRYKVLRKFSKGNDEYVGAQVLVVGSDSWRDVKDRPSPGRDHGWDACSAYLNGFIYWVDVLLKLDIGFFDFEREIFGGVSLPSEIKGKWLLMGIGVIRGYLCVSSSDYNAHVELWVMEKHGDEGGSWRKEFVIDVVRSVVGDIFGRFKPLQVLRNGEILMLWVNNDLVCYDPRTKSVRFMGSNLLKLRPRAVAFTPSFDSLKDTLLLSDKVLVQRVRPRW